MPQLLEEWPVKSDLVVPIEQAPEDLIEGMSAEWRLKNKNRKILKEKSKE